MGYRNPLCHFLVLMISVSGAGCSKNTLKDSVKFKDLGESLSFIRSGGGGESAGPTASTLSLSVVGDPFKQSNGAWEGAEVLIMDTDATLGDLHFRAFYKVRMRAGEGIRNFPNRKISDVVITVDGYGSGEAGGIGRIFADHLVADQSVLSFDIKQAHYAIPNCGALGLPVSTPCWFGFGAGGKQQSPESLERIDNFLRTAYLVKILTSSLGNQIDLNKGGKHRVSLIGYSLGGAHAQMMAAYGSELSRAHQFELSVQHFFSFNAGTKDGIPNEFGHMLTELAGANGALAPIQLYSCDDDPVYPTASVRRSYENLRGPGGVSASRVKWTELPGCGHSPPISNAIAEIKNILASH